MQTKLSKIGLGICASDFAAVMSTPFGKLGIRCNRQHVQELVFLPPSYLAQEAINPLAKRVIQQVERYLENPTAPFNLPLQKVGTSFQHHVWREIIQIPVGGICTYGGLAKKLQSAPRAVGQACGANYFPLIIPCHRVVSANGLGGFAYHDVGFHLSIKRWLLKHEGISI